MTMLTPDYVFRRLVVYVKLPSAVTNCKHTGIPADALHICMCARLCAASCAASICHPIRAAIPDATLPGTSAGQRQRGPHASTPTATHLGAAMLQCTAAQALDLAQQVSAMSHAEPCSRQSPS